MTQPQDVPTYKNATVHEIFRLTWAASRLSSAASLDATPKMSDAGLHLSSEYLRLFTVEAIHRAAQAAKEDPDKSADFIEVKHLQKVAPGLICDF